MAQPRPHALATCRDCQSDIAFDPLDLIFFCNCQIPFNCQEEPPASWDIFSLDAMINMRDEFVAKHAQTAQAYAPDIFTQQVVLWLRLQIRLDKDGDKGTLVAMCVAPMAAAACYFEHAFVCLAEFHYFPYLPHSVREHQLLPAPARQIMLSPEMLHGAWLMNCPN